MRRPQTFQLPGLSTAEQSFYEMPRQPALPGQEWPGATAGAAEVDSLGWPGRPDPSPFKLGGR